MLDMAHAGVEDAPAEVLNGEEAVMPSLRWMERSHLARWTWMCFIPTVVAEAVAVVAR